jgi:hypothetical protein
MIIQAKTTIVTAAIVTPIAVARYNIRQRILPLNSVALVQFIIISNIFTAIKLLNSRVGSF